MDVYNEEGWVLGQIFSSSDLEFVLSKGVVAVVNSGIGHDLGPLIVYKEGIVEFPFGVGSSTEDVVALYGRVTASSAHRVKPGFLNQQDVVSLVRG